MAVCASAKISVRCVLHLAFTDLLSSLILFCFSLQMLMTLIWAEFLSAQGLEEQPIKIQKHDYYFYFSCRPSEQHNTSPDASWNIIACFDVCFLSTPNWSWLNKALNEMRQHFIYVETNGWGLSLICGGKY